MKFCHLRRAAWYAALCVLPLAAAALLAADEPKLIPAQTTPPVSLTPLRLGDVGPRTENVPIHQYQHVRYVSLTTEGWAKRTGDPGAPWSSIPEALDNITDAGPNRRYAVLVAGGIHRINRLAMKPHVDLFGGFTAATWSRDLRKTPTILDGGQRGPVLEGADDARLDGFTIRNGRGDRPGGAILCRSVSPWISNNIITANITATRPIELVDPEEGSGFPGGAIACVGPAARPLVERNIIAFNSTTDGDGGAIACLDGAAARVQNNVLAGNIAGLTRAAPKNSCRGGAIAVAEGAGLELFSNVIINNMAADGSNGGAIYLGRGGKVRIQRNILAGNDAEGSGGAIFAAGQKDMVITANVLAENIAQSFGGGASFEAGCEGIIENTLVCRNQAGGGGGLSFDGVTMTLNANTVCSNRAVDGGGLQVSNSPKGKSLVKILNSLIFFNEPANEISLDLATAALSMVYCDVGEEWTGWGVFSEDPLLADDFYTGQVATMEYDPDTFQTRMIIVGRQFIKPFLLQGRVIRVGTKRSVIADNRPMDEPDHQEILVWGDMTGAGMNVPPVSFFVLSTYRPEPDSPLIDAGSDMGPETDVYGNTRPEPKSEKLIVDIGAVEYIPEGLLNPELSTVLSRTKTKGD